MKNGIAAPVVEDDSLVRFDLAQTLEAEGYRTFEAADSTQGIAVLEANSDIGVVFTDIQMPGTGLPHISIPGSKLEPGRGRPAFGLAGAERMAGQMLAARSLLVPAGDSRGMSAA